MFIFALILFFKKKDKIEKNIKLLKIKREKFTQFIVDNDFEQIAALGIIQLTSLKLRVNILHSDYEDIKYLFDALL